MIDRETVERIKNAADIVEVVGDYVHLIRRGANYMGLCPFHNERTPSFSVNKQRNFCYCFSCKKGGSPVNFIMEKEGVGYHEALLHLAKRYGIEVVEKELTDEERQRRTEREAMFIANEWAMRKMESDLHNTPEGRDVGESYLTQRGVTDEAMKAFHLGYALDSWDALSGSAVDAGFDIAVLKKLGLVGTTQAGKDYDRFKGRVIFPILNSSGKTIAFGGRDLRGGMSKYINSPESELYKKSNVLYGIFQAKNTVTKEDKCFLVEGYMDVIGMWQSGLKNVVASSGTALTDGQITLIHRLTDNITLIYDGDSAGIKASLRGIDLLLSHKMNVKVLLLPDGEDPDSFARKHTPEEFREYVSRNETDIIRFKINVLTDMASDDPQKRIYAINSIVESIAHIPDSVSRDVYIQECAALTGMQESTIARSVSSARHKVEEQIRLSRERKKIAGNASETFENKPYGDSRREEADIPCNPPKQSHSQGPLGIMSSLYPLERDVIRYCVRYAFLPFCTFEEEGPVCGPDQNNGMPRIVTLNVRQYIEEELRESDMGFSTEGFARIFDYLTKLEPVFSKELEALEKSVDGEIEKMRREGIAEIGQTTFDFAQIDRAEKKLEQKLKQFKEDKIRTFSREYPGKYLGSHQDDEIRKISFELMVERHHLSAIYTKEGNAETEEDRLDTLLLRSIDEWKNELINVKIKDLFAEFKQQKTRLSPGEEQRMQLELAKLMNLRTEMAKCIGERIIFNGKV